ncbi:MAG: ATP-binding protein [Asticcacaulis sp.]
MLKRLRLPQTLGRLPVFTQVMALCVSVLVVSILINIAIVILMPQPRPSGYTIAEAAEALGGKTVKLANGRTLKTETLKQVPDFIAARARDPYYMENEFDRLKRQRLAQLLKVSEHDVYVDGNPFFGRPRFGPDTFMPRRNEPGPPEGRPQGPDQMSGAMDNRQPPPNGAQSDAQRQEALNRRMALLEANGARPDSQRQGPPPGNARWGEPQGQGFGGPPPSSGQTQPQPQTQPQQRMSFPMAALPSDFNEQITFPAFRAAVKKADGTYVNLVRPRRWLENWQINLLLGFILTAALIAPLAWWMSRRLTQPISALAEGAAKLDFDPQAQPLKESGPAEVRQATHVLNAMQVRIRKHVDNRTAVIAAIAHDLKTPLARLRLRVESLPAKDRDRIAQDIAHMDSLIRSAMTFASAERMAQDVVRLDLGILGESLAEDMAELYKVQIGRIDPQTTVRGDQIALKRILCNLFENAHRYAEGSRIDIIRNGDQVVVTVSDNGPGIPDSEIEAVFEPFHRLESSRNRDTGGAGLGLSVARTLAEAHKGTLTLKNRLENGEVTGLDAILSLPASAT